MTQLPDARTTHPSEVQIAQGDLRGSLEEGVHAFLGVPYAAAPFGDLRMKPPAPAPGWAGVRDATAYGPTAPKGDYPPQYASLLPEVSIAGEDCLNLNVWTPDPSASGLPVFVWIHGGSFMNGSGAVAQYNGSKFARDGVVCVTINYRLGAEGFAFTPEAPSNLGVRDQVAALEWVHHNIAVFGGDPAKVTVGGESAGAMSVTTLLGIPSAEGLFRSAITQSGAGAHTLTPETAAKVTALLAEALGVDATREALAAVPAEQVSAAAHQLVDEVQTEPDPVKWGSLALSLLPFAPTVDGDVLPLDPVEAFAAGAGSNVALLTGTNAEESRLFLVAPGVIGLIDEPTARAGIEAYGAPASTFELYQGSRPDARPGDVLAAVVSDWFFRVPAIRIAESRAGATWMYRFDWRSPGCGGELGAAHAVEIPFVFDTLDSGGLVPMFGEDPPQAIADATHAAWVRFITDGAADWPAYTAETRTTRIFGDRVETTDDPAAAERAVWDDIR